MRRVLRFDEVDIGDVALVGGKNASLGERLLDAVRDCMASLFTDRAIVYRSERGFGHRAVALSVGIQRMVRSDLGAAGVAFTLDTESGFRDAVIVTGAWGLGESVVKGRVNPDEYWVHKPTLARGFRPILRRELGSKELKIVYAPDGEAGTRETATSSEEQERFVLSEDEVLELSRWAVRIEEHYSARASRPTPMDIEWAKDGPTRELYVVQARPETVHAQADTRRRKLPEPKSELRIPDVQHDRHLRSRQLPSAGVGLARIEFIVGSTIGVHPLALLHPERITDAETASAIRKRTKNYSSPAEFFVRSLASGVAQIAAAFYPRPVIVRFSDFKSNEFAGLLDGSVFEPVEQNPMIGFRGASRYYHERYREAFAQDPGVNRMIASVVKAAHAKRKKVGLCGQAPSAHPEFARFLAGIGIDSISVTSDALPAVTTELAEHVSSAPGPRT